MGKQERNDMIEAFYPLVHLVVDAMIAGGYKKYRQHRDDLVSEGTIGLIKATEKYDPGKGASEVTYFSRGIRNHVKDYVVRFEKKSDPLVSIYNVEHLIPNEEEEEYVDPDFTLINKYEPKDPINKEIYHRILMGGMSNGDLAKELGVTKNTIRLRKRRLIKRLRDQMMEENII